MKHPIAPWTHRVAFAFAAILLVWLAHDWMTWDFAFGSIVALALVASAVQEYRSDHGMIYRRRHPPR